MPRPRRCLILGALAVLLSGMDEPTQKSNPPTKSARATKGARKATRPNVDAPPDCTLASTSAPRPAARSMPELFDRMMSGFLTDPSKGFPAFVDELANMEGPALEGVTLSIAEERQRRGIRSSVTGGSSTI
jgi:hypothetical protein